MRKWSSTYARPETNALTITRNNNEAGSVSYTVYILFIAIQAAGPLVGMLLTPPSKVQRKDGKKVRYSINHCLEEDCPRLLTSIIQVALEILQHPLYELKATAKLFCTKKFLLIIPLIGQAVFSEAVFFTYLSRKYRRDEVSNLVVSWLMRFDIVWFSVRARALGSFVGGIAAVISGNLLGVS